jgi:hypothetical protein
LVMEQIPIYINPQELLMGMRRISSEHLAYGGGYTVEWRSPPKLCVKDFDRL